MAQAQLCHHWHLSLLEEGSALHPVPVAVPGGSGGCRAIAPPHAIPLSSALPAAPILSPLCPHHCPFPSPVWRVISCSVPAEDKSDPDSKAKSAKSTKKEPMSVFQVKKEKKSKKKGMG